MYIRVTLTFLQLETLCLESLRALDQLFKSKGKNPFVEVHIQLTHRTYCPEKCYHYEVVTEIHNTLQELNK